MITEPCRLIAERVQAVSHTHLPVVGAFCSAAVRDANLGDSGCRSNMLQNSQQTAQQRTLVWPPTVFLPPAISALPGAPSQCRLSDPTLVAQWVKNLPTVQETWVRSLGWEGSPGGGHGNPFQYSYLGSPMDRGAWKVTVHGVAKSQTRLSD